MISVFRINPKRNKNLNKYMGVEHEMGFRENCISQTRFLTGDFIFVFSQYYLKRKTGAFTHSLCRTSV